MTTLTNTELELVGEQGSRHRLALNLPAPGVLDVVEGPDALRDRFAAEDWFAASCELRRRAERLGYRLAISGACAGVWPTLRQRAAGGLTLTRLTRRGDTHELGEAVELFDPAPVDEVVEVVTQRRVWRDWLLRPRLRPGVREFELVRESIREGEHIIVPTRPDDARIEFVGATLGWWRVTRHQRLEPRFRANPRLVRVARDDGRTRTAELLVELGSGEVRVRLFGAGLDEGFGRGRDGFVALAQEHVHRLPARAARQHLAQRAPTSPCLASRK